MALTYLGTVGSTGVVTSGSVSGSGRILNLQIPITHAVPVSGLLVVTLSAGNEGFNITGWTDSKSNPYTFTATASGLFGQPTIYQYYSKMTAGGFASSGDYVILGLAWPSGQTRAFTATAQAFSGVSYGNFSHLVEINASATVGNGWNVNTGPWQSASGYVDTGVITIAASSYVTFAPSGIYASSPFSTTLAQSASEPISTKASGRAGTGTSSGLAFGNFYGDFDPAPGSATSHHTEIYTGFVNLNIPSGTTEQTATDSGSGSDSASGGVETPSAPLNLQASVASPYRIVLTWTDTYNGETGFSLERKTTGGAFAEIGTTAADITIYNDQGLTPSTLYVYRVRAFNLGGYSSYSNEASGTTLSLTSSVGDLEMATTPNLPSVQLTLIDGIAGVPLDRPLTESVLIVGPALDGPNDTIVKVNNIAAIEHLYGPLTFNSDYVGQNNETAGYSGNALIKALREVRLGGAADIRLLRVGGSSASGTLSSVGATTGTVVFTSKYPGRIYNNVTVKIVSGATSGKVEIAQPTIKGGTITISWAGASSGITVRQLVDRINAETRNRTVKATLGTASSTAAARTLSGQVSLSSGTYGTTHDDLSTDKTSYYTNFTRADTGSTAVMADHDCDIVYLAGIYLDDMVASADATVSVGNKLAEYLGTRTIDYPQIGVIGVRPLTDFSARSLINDHYEALMSQSSGFRDAAQTWMKAGYFMYNGWNYIDGDLNQTVDSGAYMQVVAGDVILNDPELGLYVESAAGIYAGSLARLKPHQAATHKTVPGIFELPYLFSKLQLNNLVGGVGRDVNFAVEGGAAYVTLRPFPNRGIVFTRDVTAAKRISDFRDLQPLRIANAAHKGVKEIAVKYLGESNDIPHLKALETEVKMYLDGMYDAGALLGRDGIGYTVNVRGGEDPISHLLGIVDIDITLRPALQIKQIRVKVRLSL